MAAIVNDGFEMISMNLSNPDPDFDSARRAMIRVYKNG